jgi:hypothetical protein
VCSTQFILAPNGIQVCGFDCTTITFKYNVLSSDVADHMRVSCQAGCEEGYIINQIFCVPSCRLYAAQSVCTGLAIGGCDEKYVESDGETCTNTCSDFIFSISGE